MPSELLAAPSTITSQEEVSVNMLSSKGGIETVAISEEADLRIVRLRYYLQESQQKQMLKLPALIPVLVFWLVVRTSCRDSHQWGWSCWEQEDWCSGRI